jgi:hypothetical protein
MRWRCVLLSLQPHDLEGLWTTRLAFLFHFARASYFVLLDSKTHLGATSATLVDVYPAHIKPCGCILSLSLASLYAADERLHSAINYNSAMDGDFLLDLTQQYNTILPKFECGEPMASLGWLLFMEI